MFLIEEGGDVESPLTVVVQQSKNHIVIAVTSNLFKILFWDIFAWDWILSALIWVLAVCLLLLIWLNVSIRCRSFDDDSYGDQSQA
jgi:hypothetical protein